MDDRFNEILATQRQILEAIEQAYTNFKKDGQDRKTVEKINRRLETLEKYWLEFQSNHVALCGYGIRSGEYFVNNVFEQTKVRYEHINTVLQDYKRNASEYESSKQATRQHPAEGDRQWLTPGTSDVTKGKAMAQFKQLERKFIKQKM